jgi:peptidoglycan hydrolase-like protein with peptidoglycan-binding domain
MAAAHAAGEAIRSSAGYSGGIDGSKYLPLINLPVEQAYTNVDHTLEWNSGYVNVAKYGSYSSKTLVEGRDYEIINGTPYLTYSGADSYIGKGSSGASVEVVQLYLRQHGYTDGEGSLIEADGQFGPKTLHAVRQYQADHGLEVDGRVGPATLGSMGFYLGDPYAGMSASKTVAAPSASSSGTRFMDRSKGDRLFDFAGAPTSPVETPTATSDPGGLGKHSYKNTVEAVEEDAYSITTTITAGSKDFTYTYVIEGGAIRFDFSENTYWSVLWRGLDGELAEAMLEAGKSLNEDYLIGRTKEGIAAELKAHYASYRGTLGLWDRMYVADMGGMDESKPGYDTNAGFFETLKLAEPLEQPLIRIP